MLLEGRRQLERNQAFNELRYVGQVRDWPVTLEILGTQALFFKMMGVIMACRCDIESHPSCKDLLHISVMYGARSEIPYLMFLIAACPSDHEKLSQLPVSDVLTGRSRLGLMDIHNFFNPYVFEVRHSAIVTIQLYNT